jgi:putative endonuclease
MVRCDDGSLYTGISTDVARRLSEHQDGGRRGASYFRVRKPVEVVFTQRIGDRASALSAEYAIKRLDKPQKEHLASGALTLQDALARATQRRAPRDL